MSAPRDGRGEPTGSGGHDATNEGLRRLRSGLAGASAGGILGTLVRGRVRRTVRRRRRWGRRTAFLALGVVIMLMSVATCSSDVDLAVLTEEYGPPVPASRTAAKRFLERTSAAVRDAPAGRRLRIEVTEVEATSALSLGLMMPELMRAMESLPPEEAQSIDDLAVLRERLRAADPASTERLGIGRRIAGVLDPRIRTGDVQVRFTSDGEIVVAGYIQAWRWQQPALVVFAPRAAGGEVELDFVKGRLGRLPAPEWAFDQLGGLVASLLVRGSDHAEIRELTVQEGRLTFVGIAAKR
jgi:hypothetical protein